MVINVDAELIAGFLIAHLEECDKLKKLIEVMREADRYSDEKFGRPVFGFTYGLVLAMPDNLSQSDTEAIAHALRKVMGDVRGENIQLHQGK